MAIEQSTIDQQAEFISLSDIDTVRNVPTPPMMAFDNDLDLGDLSDLGFSFTHMDTNVGYSAGTNAISNSGMFGETATIKLEVEDDSFCMRTSTLEPFTYVNMPNVGTSSELHQLNHNDESDLASVSSRMSRKDKCMSRNAIAARANREKKKDEMKDLRRKVATLEQENASYKKKYHEEKAKFDRVHDKLKYYESLFSDLQSLIPIIDHMKSMPAMDEQSEVLSAELNNYDVGNKNTGICFHVKASHDIVLKLCEQCSNGTNTIGSKMKNET